MSNGQRSITALLAAAVVLLGLNLATSNERPAKAAGSDRGEEPYVVQISMAPSPGNNLHNTIYRLWSDGTVDAWQMSSVTEPLWLGWVDFSPVQRADLNADGCVNVEDFLILLGTWNEDCLPAPLAPRHATAAWTGPGRW
jgi:hypothetical protein